MIKIDNESFAEARCRVLGEAIKGDGIGSLSERALHKIIKLYLEPNEELHELEVLGSIADIKTPERIYEIQTRALSRLKNKLSKLLTEYKVTVVYPLHVKKSICWIDASSGEMTSKRISNKHETPADAAYELYNIRELLSHPNFSLKLMFFESEEYRLRGVHKKIGRRYRSVERVECIPTSIVNILDFESPGDYLALLPPGLPESFCAADINRSVRHSFKHGYSVIAVLRALGIIDEGRREGRKILYKIINK